MRSSAEIEKGKTQGIGLKTLTKGTLLKKGTPTDAELKKEHWTYNTEFKKVINERIVSISYQEKPNTFRISNDKTGDKNNHNRRI